MANATTARPLTKGCHLKWLPIADLKVSPTGQRELKEYWVDYLVANFDLEKMQVPHVNLRDGSLWLMDGQHTVEGLRRLGFGDENVQCWFYEGLTEAEEADKFLDLNKKLAVTSFEKFNKAVAAGRAAQTDIDRIVRSLGLSISQAKGERTIGATGSLESLYQASGPKNTQRTLRIIRDSFGDTGFDASVIKGVGLVCQRFNGELNDADLIGKLSGIHAGSRGLMGKATKIRAQTNAPLNQCVAAAVVEVMNSGRGGKKLPGWWKADA